MSKFYTLDAKKEIFKFIDQDTVVNWAWSSLNKNDSPFRVGYFYLYLGSNPSLIYLGIPGY